MWNAASDLLYLLEPICKLEAHNSDDDDYSYEDWHQKGHLRAVEYNRTVIEHHVSWHLRTCMRTTDEVAGAVQNYDGLLSSYNKMIAHIL